ncbi:class I SAM-dependent methyltransferase [Aquabacter sp. P-9]|uniref:class I SAM-dependent methyltransferase n=1 Tax=Aquabacter sediminis TaxID=3029197 RepID=UPI00237D5F95|nr:class I SAM-dependent methyltransferase [Aquabacter sp. P-9]MDE1567144.1 class I SAM-dependent methyltransferase [Aquabacter sp. P-9]
MSDDLNTIGLRHGTDKASKGHAYLSHYDRNFSALRGNDLTLFEIGGLNGASLRMWCDYFPKAKVVCLDINPEVKRFENERISVEIGNSGSRSYLKGVLAKHGTPQIVLDDGSHRWDHQRIAFEYLFPQLAPGGIYVIEDVHTSHDPKYAGTDTVPFTEYMHAYADYLHMKGQKRKDFAEERGKTEFMIANRIDRIEIVPRSIIVHKKTEGEASPE